MRDERGEKNADSNWKCVCVCVCLCVCVRLKSHIRLFPTSLWHSFIATQPPLHTHTRTHTHTHTLIHTHTHTHTHSDTMTRWTTAERSTDRTTGANHLWWWLRLSLSLSLALSFVVSLSFLTHMSTHQQTSHTCHWHISHCNDNSTGKNKFVILLPFPFLLRHSLRQDFFILSLEKVQPHTALARLAYSCST